MISNKFKAVILGMKCLMAANIHHPEVFVHFFMKGFDNILYNGRIRSGGQEVISGRL